MNYKFKNIDIKNHTYNFFDDMINTKNFDPSKIKLDEKSCKKFLFTTLDVTIMDSKCFKINSVNPLHLIINKVNGCFNKYY